MNPEDLDEAFQRLREEIHCNPFKYVPAAKVILENFSTNGKPIQVGEEKRAYGIVNKFTNHLLLSGNYEEVAGILWAPSIITVEPYSVREIWAHIQKEQQPFIVGPGGVGKSRSAAAWLLCDWLADPMWTFIKLLSVTKEHAEKNIFAHVKSLHRDAAIRLPGTVLANSIRLGDRENSGFQLTTIAQGDNGKGRLRGCHPDPRPERHPFYGTHSRNRVGLDEAELVGDGAYGDIGNLLITEGADSDHMKILALTNPQDQDTPFGGLCEPMAGWGFNNPETAYKWEGHNGVKVLRIDGAKTENVIQQKIVYPGFMTYEGYMKLLARGVNDAEYWSMGRGYWPPSGTVGGFLFPSDLFDKSELRAEYVYIGTAINLGAFDTALEGGDDAVYTHGRFGYAQGVWINTGPNSRKFFKFPKNIPCLTALSRAVLPKGDSVKMGMALKAICEETGVQPENLIIDKTGNGDGVHAWCRHYWRPGEVVDVTGVDSNSSATEMKVYLEQGEPACELYKGMHTELAFALAAWMEFGYLKFGKNYPISEIRPEITKRQYITQNGKRIVEAKPAFKARTKMTSPDRMDSAGLLVHKARMIDVGTMKLSMSRPEERVDYPEPKDGFFQDQDAGVEFVKLE